jgi:alkylation response protein AidB-like acyl-CoA dehydrogenase
MDLEFTSEQTDLREAVRAVLDRECPISLVRQVVESGRPADELWTTMVSLDWPALAVPTEQGGLGLGFVDVAVVAEELGRSLAPGPLLPTMAQFVPAVREARDVTQRERFLGGVARGTVTGALALYDEGPSWDLADVAATCRRDGDSWILDGTKRHVLEATRATDLAVAAREAGTEGPDGLSLFVVPVAELKVRPTVTLDASRELAEVDLGGARVGADRCLGDPGNAGRAIARVVEEATVALAVEMVGTCQSILDLCLDYAKSRHQFGVPIGSFQAMKHKFADMFVSLERARAVAYLAAAAVAEEDDRRGLAVSMAKAAAGDCQRRVAAEGIQSLGGIGYTWEHDMHLFVKRAKSGEPLFGGATWHRSRVATMLGLPGPSPASQAS